MLCCYKDSAWAAKACSASRAAEGRGSVVVDEMAGEREVG